MTTTQSTAVTTSLPFGACLRFFWDMDGVLYDFGSLFAQHMPGIDMEDDSAWTWQELHAKCPNIYLDGKEVPGIRSPWQYSQLFGMVIVLTAVPRRWSWPNVTAHKREWMKKTFGVHHSQVRFGPYAEDKQFHCEYSTDVLIDDRIRNIEQWRARGGQAIHHVSPEQTRIELQKLVRSSGAVAV
jgi:hypothetical protein